MNRPGLYCGVSYMVGVWNVKVMAQTVHIVKGIHLWFSNATDNTGQQIFNIALLPGKILVNLIDPFNVHTNIISDLLDHVGISRNMN